MKPLRAATCLLVVLFLIGCLVGQALASRRPIRMIKDEFVYGDPDWVESVRERNTPNPEAAGECGEDPASATFKSVLIHLAFGMTGRVYLSPSARTPVRSGSRIPDAKRKHGCHRDR